MDQIRTRLTPAKKTALLQKIAGLYTAKANALVVKRGRLHLQGFNLTGVAIDKDSAGACLVFTVGPRFGVTASALVDQDLTYTAKQVDGWYANDVTVQLVDPGVLAPLAVAVADRHITVTLAHDGTVILSTADDVKAAIAANAEALALVAVTGTGAVALVALAKTPLAGGSNVQTYGKADIVEIQRLRPHRFAIVLAPTANPAA